MGPLWSLDCKYCYLEGKDLDTNLEQGPSIALGVVAAIEGVFIWRTNWEKAVEAAKLRNAAY